MHHTYYLLGNSRNSYFGPYGFIPTTWENPYTHPWVEIYFGNQTLMGLALITYTYSLGKSDFEI